MEAGAHFSLEFARDLERMEVAKREMRFREFLALLIGLTPSLVELAESAESSWFGLSENVQDEFAAVNDKLRSLQQRALAGQIQPAAREPLNKAIEKRVGRIFARLRLLPYEAELREFGLAANRFQSAVNHALADESRRRSIAKDVLAEDPEALAAMAAGEREYETGEGARYSKDEFRRRFSFS